MKKAIILGLISVAAVAFFWNQSLSSQADDASLAQITFYVH